MHTDIDERKAEAVMVKVSKKENKTIRGKQLKGRRVKILITIVKEKAHSRITLKHLVAK